MSLIKPPHAQAFLKQYKRLLSEIARNPLKDIAEFQAAREILYENKLHQTHPMDSDYEPSFVDAVQNAQYGTFIYAKKYRQGYALKYEDNEWYFAHALTTPLEEMVPEWIVVVTAVLPYHDQYVCDGLIANQQMYIGKNMIHDMIQELKVERPKWSSHRVARGL